MAAVAVLATVLTLPPMGGASAAFPGRDGRLAYTFNTDAGGFDIATIWADGTGKRRLTRNNDSYDSQYGPAGRRIAFTRVDRSNNAEVWLMGAAGKNKRPLITGAPAWDPAWSPDGSQIVYVGESDNGPQLFIYTLATGASAQLTFAASERGPFAAQPAWSPGGRPRIAYHQYRRFTDESGNTTFGPGIIAVIRPNGTGQHPVTSAGRVGKAMPSWSPNGRRIAFARVIPGANERVPTEYPGLATIRPNGTSLIRLPNTGEAAPTWAPSGTRLAGSRMPTDNPDITDFGIWTMGPRGQRPHRVLDASYYATDLDWQPRP